MVTDKLHIFAPKIKYCIKETTDQTKYDKLKSVTNLQLLNLLISPFELNAVEAFVQAIHEIWIGHGMNREGVFKLNAIFALGVGVLPELKVTVRHPL